jgi:hypothetical protein
MTDANVTDASVTDASVIDACVTDASVIDACVTAEWGTNPALKGET